MNQMISVASGFQYSVNIGYDLNNDDKLRNFIPTRSALELLEDILSSTVPSSANRARVLIGAYGKGKSHIVLTILAMLLKKDLSLFEKLMPKVRRIRGFCACSELLREQQQDSPRRYYWQQHESHTGFYPVASAYTVGVRSA